MKTIYVDCTATLMSPYVTGVQRAVLSFIHYGLSSSFEGCRIQPVVCFMGRFYALDTRVFEKSKAGLASTARKKLLVKMKDVLKKYASYIFGSVKLLYTFIHFIKLRPYLTQVDSFSQNDVLFFPDISWGMGIETAVKKVRSSCQVSTGWISYNYLKSRYLVEGCKAEIMELLQSDQERVV